MAAAYKIRCSLFGHEKDVRSVYPAFFPDGAIVSGSRDVTARVWAPNEGDVGFMEALTMRGHSNFISSVCVMPPDDMYAQGLIMTGSHDHSILAYTLESPAAIFKLTGHTDTVCALAAGKFGSLLSGSWDKTAKVWLKEKCVMTLQGHEAAVWAVAIMPEGGFMLTGSADKTIRMWRAGKCEKTFTGHTDCVRGLAVLSTSEFLSCSNDSSVRRWATSGDCIQEYYGHSNFVYSIAILPNGEDFVSAGEDRSLRVWKDGECVQTIAHPTESVWSVCVLPNGDIVTGASDGVVRVFTTAVERMGSKEEQQAFEDMVGQSKIPAQVGDIPTDQLPDKSALYNPGKRDGQTLMVKDGGSIQAHQWNASEGRWVKIGDVVGGSGGTEASSGKQLFEGKEYDYVFDVEIEEGKPPLKLPFNTSEDTWMAAHNFLERNNISQMFLDQVAKHIMDQTKGVTLGAAPGPSTSDPFTGEGRYVPGSGGSSANPSAVTYADPFTGAGRHVPQYSQPAAPAASSGADPFTGASSYQPGRGAGDSQTSLNQYFPQKTYLSFDSANVGAVVGKLKEFNSRLEQGKVEESGLDQLAAVASSQTATAQQLDLLWKLLQWPHDVMFPALDLLRLCLRNEVVNEHFLNMKDGVGFLNHLLGQLKADGPVSNQMLTLRSLCNAFRHGSGEQLMLAQRDMLVTGALNCQTCTNKNVQIALCTLLLNFAVAYHKNADVEGKSQCLSAAATVAEALTDPEAHFRLLVCLGTLVAGDGNSAALAVSLDVGPYVMKMKSVSDPKKVGECAKAVENALH